MRSATWPDLSELGWSWKAEQSWAWLRFKRGEGHQDCTVNWKVEKKIPEGSSGKPLLYCWQELHQCVSEVHHLEGDVTLGLSMHVSPYTKSHIQEKKKTFEGQNKCLKLPLKKWSVYSCWVISSNQLSQELKEGTPCTTKAGLFPTAENPLFFWDFITAIQNWMLFFLSRVPICTSEYFSAITFYAYTGW